MVLRRMKTHTADTGYVYQYYFVGKRQALSGDPDAPATEYIFDVSRDRKVTYAASVLVKPEAAEAWASAHGRSLTDTEQYAAAKMRLLRGFDEIKDFVGHGRRLLIDGSNIEELLEPLGLD